MSAAIKAVAALIIVCILAFAGWYITGLRADLAVSQNNEKVLTQGIEDQKAVITQMKIDIGKIQQANANLNSTIQRQKADVDALTKKFSQDSQGNPRDFGNFAASKPELVEKLVNKATSNVYRCMELATGAQHSESELSAKTSKEINKECPVIANPNYKPSMEIVEAAKKPVTPSTTSEQKVAPPGNFTVPPSGPPKLQESNKSSTPNKGVK